MKLIKYFAILSLAALMFGCVKQVESSRSEILGSTSKFIKGDTIGLLDGAVYEMKATESQIIGLNLALGMNITPSGTNGCQQLDGSDIPLSSEFIDGFNVNIDGDSENRIEILMDLYRKIQSRKDDLESVTELKWRSNHMDGATKGVTPGITNITFVMSPTKKEASLYFIQPWSYSSFLAGYKSPSDYIYKNWTGAFNVITRVSISRNIIPEIDGEFIEDSDPLVSFHNAIQLFIDVIEPGFTKLSVKTSFRQEQIGSVVYNPDEDDGVIVKMHELVFAIPVDTIYATDFSLDPDEGVITLRKDWTGFILKGQNGDEIIEYTNNVYSSSATWSVPKEYYGWEWMFTRTRNDGEELESDPAGITIWRYITPGIK